MIGGATHLGFMDFIINNLPIVLVVSFVTFGLLKLIYYKKLNSVEVDTKKVEAFEENRAIKDKKFLIKNLIVFALIIAAFMTHHIHHVSLASVALGGGFLLMMITKEDPEEILKEVEWPTLFFFIGLFVIVGGLEKTGVINYLADQMIIATDGEAVKASQLILWMSAVATTFINSIPYTATMISVIENMGAAAGGNVDPLWWALSLGACLGGNGTIIGAAANIIVAGFTQKTDYPLRFKEYLKVGLPLMFVSIALASVYIYFRYFFI
jgi:Na+/H+ antiporter NhaD/arsenite permease-like protein